jgi:hypothetical protein
VTTHPRRLDLGSLPASVLDDAELDQPGTTRDDEAVEADRAADRWERSLWGDAL